MNPACEPANSEAASPVSEVMYASVMGEPDAETRLAARPSTPVRRPITKAMTTKTPTARDRISSLHSSPETRIATSHRLRGHHSVVGATSTTADDRCSPDHFECGAHTIEVDHRPNHGARVDESGRKCVDHRRKIVWSVGEREPKGELLEQSADRLDVDWLVACSGDRGISATRTARGPRMLRPSQAVLRIR